MFFINLNIGYVSNKRIDKIFSKYLTQSILIQTINFKYSIIKLKDNNYLISFIYVQKLLSFYYHYFSLIIFNLRIDNINEINFNIVCDSSLYLNTQNNISNPECFQTGKEIIECFFGSNEKDEYKQFTIYIYNQYLIKLNNDISFGYYHHNSFAKIFHLKEEIGVYIFFDYEEERPKIFLEKLDSEDYTLHDLIDFECSNCENKTHKYIILDSNGKYTLNNSLYFSDAIKINDSKFVIIFKISGKNNILTCLFDLYNNDSSLRLTYYELELSLIKIQISYNLKAFSFKNYFGIIFDDSNIGYPGYIFFNYPNITSNNKIDETTIQIKLFVNSSKSYLFSLNENLEIINNNIGGKEKIKILNYTIANLKGIIIKSSQLNTEIYINQTLDIDDKLIFEQGPEGVISGNYTLEFIPIAYLEESGVDTEHIFYYGNATKNDFDEIQTFSNEIFKLIFIIECNEKCRTCSRLGDKSLDYCVKCKDYNFINENGQIICLENCNENQYKYIISDDEKYCLLTCEYNGEKLYIYNSSKILNGQKYIYEKTCVKACPENYTADENWNCVETICNYYTYFDEETKKYKCTDNYECPKNYKYLNIQKKECLLTCESDELMNNCYYINNVTNVINVTDITDKNIQSQIIIDAKNELTKNFNLTHFNNEGEISIKDGNNIYTITSAKHQRDLKNSSYNMTIIDLSECENELVEKKIIKKDEDLYILKVDVLDEEKKRHIVEYELYNIPENEFNLALLNISVCENTKVEITLPITIPEKEIYKYNISSPYYNDICNSSRTDKGTDITIKDRRIEYSEKNYDICEKGCEFSKYDYNSKKPICSCLTKTKMDIKKESDIKNKTNIIYDLKEIISVANFEVIKCLYSMFEKEEFFKISANYIIIIILLLSFVVLFLLIWKDYNKIKNLINEIITIKKSKQENNIINKRNNNKIISKKRISSTLSKATLNTNLNFNNVKKRKSSQIINTTILQNKKKGKKKNKSKSKKKNKNIINIVESKKNKIKESNN